VFLLLRIFFKVPKNTENRKSKKKIMPKGSDDFDAEQHSMVHPP